MIPESKLIRSELVIRDLSLPDDVMLARKSLIRWLALSLGMISPNESRQLLFDILEVLLECEIKNELPTTKDIIAKLEGQTGEKQNPKAVYYHLLKLKEAGILNRKKGRYSIGERDGKRLKDIFREKYVRKADDAFQNIAIALEKVESAYK